LKKNGGTSSDAHTGWGGLVEVIQSVCINEWVEEEVWRKEGDAAKGAQILDL
jgi:hypothetical protein